MQLFNSKSAATAISSINIEERLQIESANNIAALSNKGNIDNRKLAASVNLSNKFNTRINSIQQSIRNIDNGISLVTTAEAALSALNDMLVMMRDLAVQASSDLHSPQDKENLDENYQQLRKEISNIVENTQWNGHELFKKLTSNLFQIQAGPDSNDLIGIEIPKVYGSGKIVGFDNGDFEESSLGQTTIDGWTLYNERIKLDGSDIIAGFSTPTDTTKPQGSPGENSSVNTPTYISKIVSSDNPEGGNYSIKMESTGVSTDSYGVIHGPYMVSNTIVEIEAGQSVSFDWKAQGGADAYDVYAYLLNIESGKTIELLNESGDRTKMQSDWETVSKVIDKEGKYKFVFVSGTFDATGGRAAGARLYVDNIKAPPKALPDLDNTNILTNSNSSEAIAEIDKTYESILLSRAYLAASENRLRSAKETNKNTIIGLASISNNLESEILIKSIMEKSKSALKEQGPWFTLSALKKTTSEILGLIKSNDKLFK